MNKIETQILAKPDIKDYYGKDYELLAIQPFLYPYYRVEMKYIVREYSSLPLADEYLLKAIDNGIDGLEKLRAFIGLEPVVFDDIFAHLHSQGLIQKNPILHLTESGKETLTTLEQSKCLFEEVYAFIDGVTGKILIKGKFGHSSDSDAEKIKPLIKYPRNENLQSFYTVDENMTLYKALFDSLKHFFSKEDKKQEQKKSESSKKELVEITQILDQQRKIHQKIWVLFFRHNEQADDRILVLEENLQINSDMTEFINEQEEKGTKVISLSKPKKNEKISVKHNIVPQKIETINDIDKWRHGTTISTYSHPIVLEKTLKEATSEILINSPWITEQVIDASFKADLEKALKRQVHVTIIYGFSGSQSGKSDIDFKTKKYFQQLKKGYQEYFLLKETKGNHAKVIICDDKFMVVTSFNWLSFKGDKSRPLRTEYGTIIKDPAEIAKMRQELESISPANG
jgi:hypothetical protein